MAVTAFDFLRHEIVLEAAQDEFALELNTINLVQNFMSPYCRYQSFSYPWSKEPVLRHLRFVFLRLPLLFVLLLSLARPMAVYADDGTPPPPATEEPIDPPVKEAPVGVESGPSSSDALTSQNTDSETVPVSEILEAAPDSTQVVVLDENGSALPLVSQAAAEVVASADPMWCPVGILPGGPGCTTNFASPQALIDDIDSSNPGTTNSIYEQDGIIYFTANPGGEFALTRGTGNGLAAADYDVLKVYNLTLQGGWNGLNDGSGFALSGQTDFGTNHVQIGSSGNPWVGHITINNISINGASTSGLLVFTAGDINLNYIDSQNNTGNGARLVNTSGDGDVTIQNSSFDNNTQNGLRVTSNGNIILTQVTAQSNDQRGADLDNNTGSGNISIHSSSFIGNVGPGVEALSNNEITLLNVVANENLDSGAYLENIFGSGKINISGSSFSSNGVDGLEAYSNSDITLNNVTANYNAEIGASLANDTGSGNIFVSNSNFDSNTSTGQDMGLEISSGEEVTLDTVSASNNLSGSGSNITFSSLLIQNSTFNNNSSANPDWGQGLYLEGDEAEIICSQINGNSMYGIDGSNVITFTLDDVTFSGNSPGNYLGSPFITSGGCTPDEGGGGDEGGGDQGGGAGNGGDSSVPNSSPHDIVLGTGLPLHIIPVIGREKVDLNCSGFSGTKLILPNGDSIIVPCPLHDQAMLGRYTQDALPGKLKDKYSFLSAMDAEILRDGQYVYNLDTSMIVDFVIPDGQHKANLVILHWESSKWVEVPGGHVTDDGYFEATTHLTGIFILAIK